MGEKKTHRLTLYSSEKNFRTGKGTTTTSFPYYSESEKLAKIKTLKLANSEKNLAFRAKMKTYVGESGHDMIVSRQVMNIGNPKVERGLKLQMDPGTGNTTLIIGSSKAGKSTTMMWLWEKYYNKKRFISTLFSPSSHIKIFKRRKELIKADNFGESGKRYIEMERYINRKCKNKYWFINLFDDVIDVRFNRIINELILTYRNANVSTIINLQYVNLLGKSARSNVNNVIFQHLNTDADIETTIKAFLKSYLSQMGLTSMINMISFYRKMTKDYGIIYLHPISEKISFHKLRI